MEVKRQGHPGNGRNTFFKVTAQKMKNNGVLSWVSLKAKLERKGQVHGVDLGMGSQGAVA